MKSLKLASVLLLTLLMMSCATIVPLNQQFYNDKKVGIVLEIDSIGMSKTGSQGLLDMALTPGNRFKKPLKEVEPKLVFNETLKTEIGKIFNKKNKQFIFINEKIYKDSLAVFEKPDSNKKYSKMDYRSLKPLHNVDEIMVLKVRYGLLVSYYGAIELDKQGYVNIGSSIIDLNDNSLLQNETIQSVSNMDGNWKEGENLKNSIQRAINYSLETLRSNFKIQS